jgi:hypothetical protein
MTALIDDVLDDSWIKEQQRIHDINFNYCKEPMENISIASIFVNNNKQINNITTNKVHLSRTTGESPTTLLPKERLIELIQKGKKSSIGDSSSRYKIAEVATFIVDINPEDIQRYTNTTDVTNTYKPFFKTQSRIHDVVIPDSVFIFHKVNSIFFIFQEISENLRNHTIKSILKNTDNKKTKATTTKRVNINVSKNQIYPLTGKRNRKTRKFIR